MRKCLEIFTVCLPAWLVMAGLLASCSVLIDVTPDCDLVADCGEYVCNAENTACLTDCTNNADCAPGFVCERGGSACISQGCLPMTDPISLFQQQGSGFEYDVARVGSAYWVIAASSDGVGLTDVDLDGGTTGNLVALDQDPALPVDPLAISSGGALTLLWHGEPATNLEDIRYFHLNADDETSGPRVVFTGAAGQNIDSLNATAGVGEIVMAWATFLDRSQIEAFALDVEGTVGEEPTLLTADSTGSSVPALATTEDAVALVRRETNSGENTVVISFLDDDLARLADQPLSETTTNLLDAVEAAGMDTAVAAAWIETQGDGRLLLRAVASSDGLVRAGTESHSFTDDPSEVSVAAGSSEFAIAWIAEDNRLPDIFMRRFDEAGDGLFVPFPVSSGAAISPGQPKVVRTSDGYGVFWVDFGFESPQLFYRRYECVR